MEYLDGLKFDDGRLALIFKNSTYLSNHSDHKHRLLIPFELSYQLFQKDIKYFRLIIDNNRPKFLGPKSHS